VGHVSSHLDEGSIEERRRRWAALRSTVVGASRSLRDTPAFVTRDAGRRQRLDREQRQQRQVDFLAQLHDVLALSGDMEQIVGRITTSVVPDLAEWCSIVVTADRPPTRPLIRVAHPDPAKVQWAEQIRRDHPYDPGAPWGAAKVISTGRREFIRHVDERVYELPGGDVLRRAGVGSVITVPLVGVVGTLGALQLIRDTDAPPFTDADLEFVDELAARVGAALNTAVLFERLVRSRSALDILQQVSGRIASMASPEEVMHAALTHGVRGVDAPAGTLFLANDGGDLVVGDIVGEAGAHRPDVELATARRTVVEGALVTAVIGDSPAEMGTIIGIPMQIMNRTIGAIVLRVADDRALSAEELSMLVTLGSRCAGALERASLYERDRAVALTLQNRLLSVLPTTPPWLEAAARYVPATGIEIGGDWFQVLDAGSGRIAAVVGDAVGHGVGSAAAMGQLRASIATAVANDPRPGPALAAVDLFARRGADTLGASVACLLLDPSGWATYACAGHPPPLRLSATGQAEVLGDGRRPLLGLDHPESRRDDGSVPFGIGDTLVLYTDGLVERRGEPIDVGIERLRRRLESGAGLDPESFCNRLLSEADIDRAVDDIALLILRRCEDRVEPLRA
jgi:GAF domain-containing protein